MIDSAITEFFDQRKQAWLKGKIKGSTTEDEKKEFEAECDHLFSFPVWLPNAAKRAGQISMSTHPCTFSHPSARKNKSGYVTPTLCQSLKSADGYLKNGNVVTEVDALGNAAAIDVYKFLTLKMEDDKLLIDHIESDSGKAKELLSIPSATYQELKEGFLAMKQTSGELITSSKIKQVYFPVADDYHLLSLLTNSGTVFELRKRIDRLRFSDESKEIRQLKNKNEYSDDSFSDLFNITTIGYGGTKPQNISILNNQWGGKAYLMASTPPMLGKRTIGFPKSNFFGETIRPYECREIFSALHKVFVTDYNNHKIREGRDYRIRELLDRIIGKMWMVRSIPPDDPSRLKSSLKEHQQIWLNPELLEKRENEDAWLEKLTREITNWMILSYEKTQGKQAVMLGKDLRKHVIGIVTENKEALR